MFGQRNKDAIVNTKYSSAVCENIHDVMTVYVTVIAKNKGLLDWAINDKIIGVESLEIYVPEEGLVFAISSANWDTPQRFILKNISTPKYTFSFGKNE